MCRNGTEQIQQHRTNQQQIQQPENEQLHIQDNLQLNAQQQGQQLLLHQAAQRQEEQPPENVTNMIAHAVLLKMPDAAPGNLVIPDLSEVDYQADASVRNEWKHTLRRLRPDLRDEDFAFGEDRVRIVKAGQEEPALKDRQTADEEEEIIVVKEKDEMTEEERIEDLLLDMEVGEGVIRNVETLFAIRTSMADFVARIHTFTQRMEEMRDSGRFTREELQMRIDCFWSVNGIIADGKTAGECREFLEVVKRREYDHAKKELDEVLNALEQQGEGRTLEQQLAVRYQRVEVDAGQRSERGSLSAKQAERIAQVDRWLLESLTQRQDGMEHAEVFRLLNRSMRERLFAYYLIEHGYMKNVSELAVIAAQTDYTPDIEKIKKAGFDLSGLGAVYQDTVQSASLIYALGEYDAAEKDAASEEKEEYLHGDLQKLEHLASLKDAIRELETKTQAYESCSRIRFLEKRERKKEVENAKKLFYQSLAGLLAQLAENAGIVKSMDYAKGPEFYSGKEFLGDATLSATGMKAAGALGAALSGSVNTTYGANALGGLIGMVNLLTAVLQFSKIKGGFANMTAVNQMSAWMDVSNMAISPVQAMASSASTIATTFYKVQFQAITQSANATAAEVQAAQATLASAATAGQVIAGAGIAVGTFSTVAGVHKLLNISSENDQRERAAARFQRLRQKEENQQGTLTEEQKQKKERTESYEDNLLKIQTRINRRKKISAGCQVASGVCAMAAGTMAVLGMKVAAGAVGLAGFAISATGIIVTRVMKRMEYESVVDEFLGLEKMVDDRCTYFKKRTGNEPSKKERRKIREQLRKELMALCGFTSVKAFYANIMKTYAVHICSKLQPVLADPNLRPTADQLAYLDLVGSLGLKIERTEQESKRRPTVAMVFQKLMS